MGIELQSIRFVAIAVAALLSIVGCQSQIRAIETSENPGKEMHGQLLDAYLKITANPLNPQLEESATCTAFRDSFRPTKWRRKNLDSSTVRLMSDFELVRELAHERSGCDLAASRFVVLADEVERRGILDRRDVVRLSRALMRKPGVKRLALLAMANHPYKISSISRADENYELVRFENDFTCRDEVLLKDGVVVGSYMKVCNAESSVNGAVIADGVTF